MEGKEGRKERDGGGRGRARRRKNIIDATIYVKIKPTVSSYLIIEHFQGYKTQIYHGAS